MTRDAEYYLQNNCFDAVRNVVLEMLKHSVVFANLAKLDGLESPTPEELAGRIHFETLDPPEENGTFQDIYGDEDAPELPPPPDWLADKTPFAIVYGSLENPINWVHVAAPLQYLGQTELMIRLERRVPDGMHDKEAQAEYESHYFGMLDELVDLSESYGLMSASVRCVTPAFRTAIEVGKLKGERHTGLYGLTIGIGEE